MPGDRSGCLEHGSLYVRLASPLGLSPSFAQGASLKEQAAQLTSREGASRLSQN